MIGAPTGKQTRQFSDSPKRSDDSSSTSSLITTTNCTHQEGRHHELHFFNADSRYFICSRRPQAAPCRFCSVQHWCSSACFAGLGVFARTIVFKYRFLAKTQRTATHAELHRARQSYRLRNFKFEFFVIRERIHTQVLGHPDV